MGHILEGIIICLSNIDKIIEIIKKSKNLNIAKNNLLVKNWFTDKLNEIFSKHDIVHSNHNLRIKKKEGKNAYYLSEAQTQSILDMKLNKLTNLETKNVL